MSTKKAYVELVSFLESNKAKKVSTILEEVYRMTQAKQSQTNSHYNEDGELIAIFCYYHKRWELLSEHTYGAKKGTKTGLNSMCKVGVNQWTKQQAQAKKANGELLLKVSRGEIAIEDIPSVQAEIEAERVSTKYEDDYVGFESIDELTK